MTTTLEHGIAGTFARQLANLIADEIRRYRQEGTTAIGRDCLWQCIVCRISHLDQAPRGTNAAYFARQTFNEVCDHLPPNLRNFLLT